MNTWRSAQYIWIRRILKSKLPIGIDTLTKRVEPQFKVTGIRSSLSGYWDLRRRVEGYCHCGWIISGAQASDLKGHIKLATTTTTTINSIVVNHNLGRTNWWVLLISLSWASRWVAQEKTLIEAGETSKWLVLTLVQARASLGGHNLP